MMSAPSQIGGLPVGAVPVFAVQPGGKAFYLPLPVVEQAPGHDDQRGRRIVLPHMVQSQQSDGLYGLSQAHIVGQAASEALLLQVAHPLQPRLLVGPEGPLQGKVRRQRSLPLWWKIPRRPPAASVSPLLPAGRRSVPPAGEGRRERP